MSVVNLLFICLLPCVEGILFGCDNQCGIASVQLRTTRIIGGQESTLGAMPWMVAIADGDFFLCGGAIISSRLILTAAHCFDDSRDASRLRVYAAKHSLLRPNSEEQELSVEKLFLHSDYENTSGANDIALLVLSQPLTFDTLIAPICLPQSSLKVAEGLSCIVAGWGLTEGTGTDYVMNQLVVPVISDSTCAQSDWHGDTFLPELSFCAGYTEGGKDACQRMADGDPQTTLILNGPLIYDLEGDSGSPLIHKFGEKWTAVGIVSKGEDCALPLKPGIYTNVSHYVSWIEETSVFNGLHYPCSVPSMQK